MTNFEDLSKKPSRFLSFTGFTLEEFLALLPYFALKFQQYMENFTFEGKIRQKHKYVEYKNACLPTIENKLLFILTYLKGNDLQERIAEMFCMSQPKANIWIPMLHIVLNQALEEIDALPARDTDSLKLQFDKLAEETTPETETVLESTVLESLETTANIEVIELPKESLSLEMTAEVDANEMEVKALEIAVEVETIADANMELLQLFLHDGTERPINRPLYDAIQKFYYSGKQKQHTLKNILLTDVNGYVHFLSDTCEGKKHDKRIADEAGYILPKGSYLDQDTGFQGVEISGVNIVQPKKNHEAEN